MADIYRKASLEKLSNPEQLDRMIKISSPMSWLALIAVLLIVVVTVVWSIVGTLPTTETVSGVIVSTESTCAVYSDTAGVVEKYHKKSGDTVKAGDSIADIKLTDGKKVTIKADIAGKLSVLSTEEGASVLAGTEIARITPDCDSSQLVVCYVPFTAAAKYEKDMKVLVYPAAVDSQKYGHMEAKVLYVEKYAVNTASLAYILGNGNMVAEQFAANGPVVAVLCELEKDSSATSGFYWSSEKGKDLTVQNGTVVSAKIVVDECAPITKLIGKLKDIMEG